MSTTLVLKSTGVAVEVVEKKGGWITYLSEDGSNKKARASAFEGGTVKGSKSDGKAKPKAKSKRAAVTGNIIRDRSGFAKYTTDDGVKGLDCGDKVAKQLRGLELEGVYTEVARAIRHSDSSQGTIDEIEKSLRTRYGKLNPGQQRMSLGNRMRGALSKQASA